MKKCVNGLILEMTDEELRTLEAARIQFEESPEYAEQKIADLKKCLAETDYLAIKYAEGWMTEADYGPIRAHRQSLRDQIHILQGDSRKT